jgi:hypothetical protein
MRWLLATLALSCAHLRDPDCSKMELPDLGYSAAYECTERPDGTVYWQRL